MTVPDWHGSYSQTIQQWYRKVLPRLIDMFDLTNHSMQSASGSHVSAEQRAHALLVVLAYLQGRSTVKGLSPRAASQRGAGSKSQKPIWFYYESPPSILDIPDKELVDEHDLLRLYKIYAPSLPVHNMTAIDSLMTLISAIISNGEINTYERDECGVRLAGARPQGGLMAFAVKMGGVALPTVVYNFHPPFGAPSRVDVGISEMEYVANQEPDDIGSCISSKHPNLNWEDWELLSDGTVVVAATDFDFDPEDSSDDPDTIEAFREAVEAGDVFGIIHFDKRGEIIDSLWGMAGYGGSSKAIDGYAEQMGWKKNKFNVWVPHDVTEETVKTVMHAMGRPYTPPKPVTPAEPEFYEEEEIELTADEQNLVDWMLRQKWYTSTKDAIEHIFRMRQAGVNGLEDMIVFTFAERRKKRKLMQLPSWRRG